MIGLPIIPLCAGHRYHAAFDAVLALQADLVLDERWHPGAGEALTEWAAMRNKSVVPRDVGDGWPKGMLSVATAPRGTSRERSIDVYLR